MQRLANQKHRVLDGVARALAECELRLRKAARRIAHEVEDRDERTGRGLAGTLRRHAAGCSGGTRPLYQSASMFRARPGRLKAAALAVAQRRTRPAARAWAQRGERLLPILLVELHELIGEFVTEDHLVLDHAPLCARVAAHFHLDGERLAPGLDAGEPVAHPLQDFGHAQGLLEDIERSLGLAVDNLVFRALLVLAAQVGLEGFVPRP